MRAALLVVVVVVVVLVPVARAYYVESTPEPTTVDIQLQSMTRCDASSIRGSCLHSVEELSFLPIVLHECTRIHGRLCIVVDEFLQSAEAFAKLPHALITMQGDLELRVIGQMTVSADILEPVLFPNLTTVFGQVIVDGAFAEPVELLPIVSEIYAELTIRNTQYRYFTETLFTQLQCVGRLTIQGNPQLLGMDQFLSRLEGIGPKDPTAPGVVCHSFLSQTADLVIGDNPVLQRIHISFPMLISIGHGIYLFNNRVLYEFKVDTLNNIGFTRDVSQTAASGVIDIADHPMLEVVSMVRLHFLCVPSFPPICKHGSLLIRQAPELGLVDLPQLCRTDTLQLDYAAALDEVHLGSKCHSPPFLKTLVVRESLRTVRTMRSILNLTRPHSDHIPGGSHMSELTLVNMRNNPDRLEVPMVKNIDILRLEAIIVNGPIVFPDLETVTDLFLQPQVGNSQVSFPRLKGIFGSFVMQHFQMQRDTYFPEVIFVRGDVLLDGLTLSTVVHRDVNVFPALVEIGGHLTMHDLGQDLLFTAAKMQVLPQLEKVGLDVHLHGMQVGTLYEVLPKLAFVGGSFVMDDMPLVSEVTQCFKSLTVVGGLSMREVGSISSSLAKDSFGRVTSVGQAGVSLVYSNVDLDRLFRSITRISGSVTIVLEDPEATCCPDFRAFHPDGLSVSDVQGKCRDCMNWSRTIPATIPTTGDVLVYIQVEGGVMQEFPTLYLGDDDYTMISCVRLKTSDDFLVCNVPRIEDRYAGTTLPLWRLTASLNASAPPLYLQTNIALTMVSFSEWFGIEMPARATVRIRDAKPQSKVSVADLPLLPNEVDDFKRATRWIVGMSSVLLVVLITVWVVFFCHAGLRSRAADLDFLYFRSYEDSNDSQSLGETHLVVHERIQKSSIGGVMTVTGTVVAISLTCMYLTQSYIRRYEGHVSSMPATRAPETAFTIWIALDDYRGPCKGLGPATEDGMHDCSISLDVEATGFSTEGRFYCSSGNHEQIRAWGVVPSELLELKPSANGTADLSEACYIRWSCPHSTVVVDANVRVVGRDIERADGLQGAVAFATSMRWYASTLDYAGHTNYATGRLDPSLSGGYVWRGDSPNVYLSAVHATYVRSATETEQSGVVLRIKGVDSGDIASPEALCGCMFTSDCGSMPLHHDDRVERALMGEVEDVVCAVKRRVGLTINVDSADTGLVVTVKPTVTDLELVSNVFALLTGTVGASSFVVYVLKRFCFKYEAGPGSDAARERRASAAAFRRQISGEPRLRQRSTMRSSLSQSGMEVPLMKYEQVP